MEIVSTLDRMVEARHALALPQQLTFLHAIDSVLCTSVCSYQGKTYLGLYQRVDVIEGDNQSRKKFKTATDWVHSVAVYKDRLYTLVYGNPYIVTVHDLTGKLISSWTHSDITQFFCFNKLTIVNNQIVIPDRQNKMLVVYSLTGEVQKQIECNLLRASSVSLCAAKSYSVVVSDLESSKVFKVNLSSGEVEWISERVTKPLGVTYYRQNKVLVTNTSTACTRVWILDGETGI